MNVIKNPTQSYVISQLKIGDILQNGDHSMLVYDYVFDENGNIEDVYLINSLQSNYYMSKMKAGHGESVYYYNKSGEKILLRLALSPRSNLYFTYRDRISVYTGLSGIEGTIRLERLTVER
ncbi:hypothetical protein J5751_02240 [bacterium]|nr:hypothetical protein [bacterium]